VTDRPPRPLTHLLHAAVATGGLVLLVVAVRQVGWPDVVVGIRSVGAWFLVIVLLGLARMGCRARAWRVCAEPSELPFRRALVATLAADALGNLTPLGLLASEPTKIALARTHLSSIVSVSSVAVENGFYTASVLAMLMGGAWVFLQQADVPAALERVGQAAVGAAAVVALVAVWMARWRPAVLSRIAQVGRRMLGRPAADADAMEALEARFYSVMDWPAARFARMLGWEAAFHLLALTEVWLILRLLTGGGATIADAFLLETAGRFITVAFKFVPYRLGVDELGSGTLAQVLGLGSTVGVTVALVRRLRILAINAAGLAGLMVPGGQRQA
jgi:hypothetical protein